MPATGSLPPVTLTLPLPTSALFCLCRSFMSLAAEFILDAEYCPFLISIHNLLSALRRRRRGTGDGDRKRLRHRAGGDDENLLPPTI